MLGSVDAMPPRKQTPPSDGGSSSGKRTPRKPRTASTGTRRKTTKQQSAPTEPPPPETPDRPVPEPDTFGRWSQSTPTDTADLASYFGRLISVSSTRVGLLGDLLAEEYKSKKLGALRRITYTATGDGGSEPSGEVPTALVKLEMEERRTLERLLVKAAELGIEMRNAQAREANARGMVTVLMAFAERLGLDQQDPEIRRLMQLAALDARKVIGQ